MSSQEDPINADLVRSLHKKVKELEGRVEELEAELEDGSSSSGGFGVGADARDRAVLEALEPGQEYHTRTLMQLYREHTDIRNKRKLKTRVKALKQRDSFSTRGGGWCVYRGDDDD